MSRLALPFLAVALFSAGPAFAQEHDGPPPMPELAAPAVSAAMGPEALSNAVDAWAADLARQGQFNGVLLLARDGAMVVERAYGLADNARNTPVTVETRFNIASIGKELTRAAIMQLVEQGRLSMATTIGDVLPDYPQARARTATVAQLLNHTGGVSDFFSPAFAQADKSEFASNHDYYLFVSQLPQSFAPGEREEYCNGCYVVLGEMIARVSGVTYEDYIAANVYPRAGMTHSGFLHADQTAPSVARPYGRPDGEALIDVSDMHGVAGSAAGGSYATARDLLALDNAVREGRLFGAPGARDTGGMGIAGGAPGVNAVIAGEGRWTVIVLANRSPPIASAMAQTLLRRLAGQGGAD